MSNSRILIYSCHLQPSLYQISPASPLHRHWHPPRRWRGGGFLHHRPRDDGVIPQVRRVFPWHGRPEGKLEPCVRYFALWCSQAGCWHIFVLLRTSVLGRANTMPWITRWGTGSTTSPTRPSSSLWANWPLMYSETGRPFSERDQRCSSCR